MQAGDDQEEQVRRLGAEDRADDENGDRRAEDGARAVAVGDRAACRNEDREAKQIGGERDAHRRRADAEISRHSRQRCGEHGRVKLLHEHGACDDQRDHTKTRGGPPGWGAWKIWSDIVGDRSRWRGGVQRQNRKSGNSAKADWNGGCILPLTRHGYIRICKSY